jgi:hypothetical protein
MPQTKIVLSEKELRLLNDDTVWQTKQSLTTKLYQLLADVAATAKQHVEDSFKAFPETQDWNSKISRGENYDGCPYLILDAPNYFTKNDIVALRSLIWFGNYASCFLLLRGAPFKKLLHKISKEKLSKYGNEIYLCNADTPWNHKFTTGNMIRINEYEAPLSDLPFLKLGLKKEIVDADELHHFFLRAYTIYAELIA